MAQVLTEIDRELDEIGYEWLGDTHPRLLQAIEREVDRGADPQHIRRRVLDRTDRRELALRCEQAARHVQRDVREAEVRELALRCEQAARHVQRDVREAEVDKSLKQARMEAVRAMGG